MHKQIFIGFLMIATCLNCGSGTFENDENTWNKVFGEDPSEQIKIINTRFWKSAHWTYEFELYAQFETSDEFLKSYFIDHYKFSPTDNPKLDLNFQEEKPKWFVPKKIEYFSVLESQTNNMIIFIDNTSKEIYLYALQV